MRVGNGKCEAVGETLLHFGLDGVVVRRARVVAVGGDVLKARIRFEQLGRGHRLSADRTRGWDLAVVRVGDLSGQRSRIGKAGRKLTGGELIQVVVGDADMHNVRTDIGYFPGKRVAESVLQGN